MTAEPAVRIRELKYRGEGSGRTFKAPDGTLYNAHIGTVAGALNLFRVTMEQVDDKGKVVADLGFGDIRYSADADIEKMVMEHITATIRAAERRLDNEQAGRAYLEERWGVKPNQSTASKQLGQPVL